MPYTEENEIQEQTKKSLLLAGIREIEKSGLASLSLRKVANACGVSCAAPYRHFESKESFVFAIIAYVNSQWEMLKDRVSHSFENEPRRKTAEICLATVLFWRANPNFKSIIMIDDRLLDSEQQNEKNRIADEISHLVRELCGGKDTEKTVFLIKSVLYGSAADTSTDIAIIKDSIDTILPR